VEALNWFRKSAAHGNAKARANLSHAYACGFAVPQDKIKALAWMYLSIEAGTEPRHAKALENELGPEGSCQARELSAKLLEESPKNDG
jgi:TPR repeat protein